MASVHWWFAQGTKWMVQWGWLERPQRRGEAGTATDGGWLDALLAHRGLAEAIGEWAFYAAVALVVLALVKRFPYRLFAKTHRLLAVAWLALAWHALVLFDRDGWSQPVGWLVAALLAAGTAAAVLVLAGRVGAANRAEGRLVAMQTFEPLRVLRATIALTTPWRGHAAGQFAFVTVDPAEGAHPYTIASAWNPARRAMVFVIKALGDHTAQLHRLLRPGQTVTIEGPYGRFDFADGAARQVWIGAGIGITPFLARLQALAQARRERPDAPAAAIDLFHTTRDVDPEALGLLAADARAAGVRLHVLVDARDGLLDAGRIRGQVPDWPSASFWFCGPSVFGQALAADLVRHGLDPDRFHQELFEMR